MRRCVRRHMIKTPQIKYDKTQLAKQWNKIVKSQYEAHARLVRMTHRESSGLTPNDPPEIWRYVIGRSQQPPRLNKADMKTAERLIARARQIDPKFRITSPGSHKEFRAKLGMPSLRESAQHMAERIRDDSKLAKHLSRLLSFHHKKPITQNQRERAQSTEDKEKRILVMNWIQDPPGENWATASFCFFSDLALAKFTYYLVNKCRKWMPLHQQDLKTQQIKKIYQRLGLVPARPRIFKDVRLVSGTVHFLPYSKRTF